MRARRPLFVRASWVALLATACGDHSALGGEDGGTTSSSSSGGETAGATSESTEGGIDGGDATTTTTETGGDASGSTSAGESEASTGDVPLPGFDPQPCPEAAPDVSIERLCEEAADPEAAPDKVFIHCATEGACQGGDPPARDSLLVMAFNIARGGSYDGLVAAFASGALPMPDVLLMSEVDRGCSRTGGRNVAWELAAELGMHHAYGVEFVELPRPDGSIAAPCEHGNAVLSRFPIGNVDLLRHATNESWYDVEEEPRLGGRMALRADLRVGDRLVHVAALHFESGVEDGLTRAVQAAELADLVAAEPNPGVVGGDTNAGLYAFDLALGTHNEGTTEAFFDRGFTDAHVSLNPTVRATKGLLVLDLILLHGPTAMEPVVCPADVCDPLSDHRAVWATISLP